MKKAVFAGMVLMLVVAVAMPVVQAQDQGKQTQAEEGWYCPRMGRGAMMGGGRGFGCGMMNPGCARRMALQGPLSKEQAQQLLDVYVQTRGIPGLKLGGVEERGDVFEGSIVTNQGAPVGKIQVDKKTGLFRNAS